MAYSGEEAPPRAQGRAPGRGDVARRPPATGRHSARWSGDGGEGSIEYPERRSYEALARAKGWLGAKAARFGQPEALVTFAVVAACVVFMFVWFQPSNLLRNTTISGGDTGAHILLPWVAMHQLLPNLRLTGWTSSNWDGFPAVTFYFPLPIYSAVALAQLVPYNIAFKLVTAAPMVLMPVAAWLMGRISRAPFPVPAVLAAGTLPYMFGTEYSIYGGNIASTLAGEFADAWSLCFALVFLGLVMRGLQTGRYRAWAAVLLACTFMSHIDPFMFAVVGTVLLVAMHALRTRDWRAAVYWALPVGVVGCLLAAWWAWPFFMRFPYVTNMGYQRITSFVTTLFPSGDTWLFIMAGIGAMMSIARRRRIGEFFAAVALLAAVAFRFMPQSILWNARVLPFWFLSLYLLAALAVAEAYMLVVERAASYTATLRYAMLPGPLLVLLLALGWVLFPLRALPGEHIGGGTYGFLGFQQKTESYIPSWITWNYSGYQAGCNAQDVGCDKPRWPEFQKIVAEMEHLSKSYGCGNVMWEYQSEMNDYGTPDALTTLPYWTNGCIGSMEGLYYEASATTPFHFLDQSELSLAPSDPMVGLPYSNGPDVALGVQHLQMLGVKYYMAISPSVQRQADADPSLKLVSTLGPFEVDYTSSGGSGVTGEQERYWKFYLVLGSPRVHPLANWPVVMSGLNNSSQPHYLHYMTTWYDDPSDWDVYVAASGPKNWARVPYDATNLPVDPAPQTQVSDIVEHNASIDFNVSRTGTPVVVTISYFPNWQVQGAKGPYRISPNLMVVVPTSHHVHMWYGFTPVDYEGWGLSIVGLAGLVLLVRRPRATLAVSRLVSLGEGDGARWPRLVPLRNRPGEGDGRAGPTTPARPGPGSSPPAKVEGAMTSLDQVFKAYDIRAVVPDGLNADLARKVGSAFASFAKSARVVVGHDMRPSGPELVAAFNEGVTSAGVDVVDLGLTSTDELFYASGALDAPGAMFTASHNPARYNGIKLCLAGARPVGIESGLAEIRAAIESGDLRVVPEAERGTVSHLDVLADYAAKVRSFVDISALRPLHVVTDTANGMGGLVVPAVFKGLPFQLDMLYPELDGTFPNHPADPIQPANLRDLQARVVGTGADVGLAFDGDADRCFLVDDKGQPVSGSTTTAIVAKAMLEKYPGSIVLHNLICSKAVPEVIRENGGTPVVTRVGHSFIKAVMAQTGAVFGGEHSGHYYFRDNYRADSGSIAALVVLEVISKAGVPLSELRKPFDRYAGSGEVNTEVANPAAVVRSIAEAVAHDHPEATLSDLDGITADFGDWWFNVRPSNTEPLVRLNVEAKDRPSCEAHTEEVLAWIRQRAQL
ncbi:MAG: phosphomannomutase/phosphoglucomutase [Acidimicrobiales bacterium]